MAIKLEEVTREELIAIIANYADGTHGGQRHEVSDHCHVTKAEADYVFDVASACMEKCVEENDWRIIR